VNQAFDIHECRTLHGDRGNKVKKQNTFARRSKLSSLLSMRSRKSAPLHLITIPQRMPHHPPRTVILKVALVVKRIWKIGTQQLAESTSLGLALHLLLNKHN